MLPSCRFPNRRGFTFIEVMVTLVILSVGIVAIFKSFLISLDQIDYLTDRLHASIALENIFFQKEKMLRDYKELARDVGKNVELSIGNKTLLLDQVITLSEIESYPDLFSMDLSLSWKEGDKTVTLKRSGYIYDVYYLYKNPNG